MSIYKTSAILLKSRKYKEKDKLLTFYTEDFGKLVARCKGARDPLNHWGHNAEPPNVCWLQLYERNKFYIVTEIKPIFNLFDICKDFKKLIAFETFVQILDHFQEYGIPSIDLFGRCLLYLHHLNQSDKNPIFLSYQFMYEYLQMQGFPVLIDSCLHCKKPFSPLENGFSISYEEGGLLCKNCVGKTTSYNPVSNDLLIFLKKFLSLPLGEQNNQMEEFFLNWEDLDRIVKDYYQYRFNKKLQTYMNLKKM